MTPTKKTVGWRTSDTGCFRFNRDFTRIGVGRIATSSRTRDAREFERRNAILTCLAEAGQIDVLRDFRAGRITIEELLSADRAGRLLHHDLVSDVALRTNLWDAVESFLPRMGGEASTRRRYEVTFNALRRRASSHLPQGARLADLERVNWAKLHSEWGRSSADWNHVRRAVSALLSTVLHDKFHPFRRRVMAAFPKAVERGRVPDLAPETFKRIFDAAVPHARPAFVVLALTGMRVGEYLACTREHVMPETCQILVPGTKTAGSAAVIRVAEDMWPWVERGIPSP